ncbi:MAG TPA: transcription antitermination factor NusB [Leucothrix mucor]|uniref:Transcription antitermination protein NusB n=1 Tax=Leucothrix mucor TaxID=45248 RepID=A0A7V2T0K2_LEUMU|nr:transcription antitermination factor NusB [Leucothrix mucor]
MAIDPKRQFIAQRQVARKLALITIYQWQMTANSYHDLYVGIQEDKALAKDFDKADAAYYQSLCKYVINHIEEVDGQLKPFLDRDPEYLDQIERAALRMATAEFLNHPETPYKVIVNEAVNLTKKFGADKAHKFVNGVLDKVGNSIRAES